MLKYTVLFLSLALLGTCGGDRGDFKQNIVAQLKFNRSVVDRLLNDLEKTGKADALLRKRVDPKRAPLGWHLMHLAATEDRFAGFLVDAGPKISPAWAKKFRSGKEAAGDIPPLKDVRKYLKDTRSALLKSINAFPMARINETPKGERFDFKTAFPILLYHEPHHHGQAKATFNILKNR